jgi:hypothetical protein
VEGQLAIETAFNPPIPLALYIAEAALIFASPKVLHLIFQACTLFSDTFYPDNGSKRSLFLAGLARNPSQSHAPC